VGSFRKGVGRIPCPVDLFFHTVLVVDKNFGEDRLSTNGGGKEHLFSKSLKGGETLPEGILRKRVQMEKQGGGEKYSSLKKAPSVGKRD